MREDLIKIKEEYAKGNNLLSYFKNDLKIANTSEAIAISYDFQAGSYVKYTIENPEFENERASLYSGIINDLGKFKTILEVGVGEGTTFSNVLSRLNYDSVVSAGYDISYSRI